MRRPRLRALLALALTSSLSLAPARCQEATPLLPDPEPEDTRTLVELTLETRAAIEEGVDALAAAQLPSGAWTSDPARYQMSVTALAGLALLAHGDTPETGRYAEHVRRAVGWVLESQQTTGPFAGLLFQPGESPGGHEDRPMHGHGFALLFLGEAYGQTSDPSLRDRLHRAIAAACRLTERTISPQGGWFYHPTSQSDEGSVTITQIQGLRSARNAGVHVDPNVVARAVEYVKRCQAIDGGIQYRMGFGNTSPALTAAGMAVLFGGGEYRSEAIERGFAYLRTSLRTTPEDTPFFFYTHFYAAQAMFQRGGPEWAGYFPRIRRELLERRHAGCWEEGPPVGAGRWYATALALLILQIPMRYLPIFQR